MTAEVETSATSVENAGSLVGKRKFAGSETTEDPHEELPATMKKAKMPMTKAREIRLEQNRKAARESRRRKKVMIEELQRSVIFFSRANNALKTSNEELTRLLMQAQAHVANQDGEKTAVPVGTNEAKKDPSLEEQQKEAQTVATQAVFESQGYPAAAARAAAQAVNGGMVPILPNTMNPNNLNPGLPPMQPGATMQAMANFQQAAAAAMQNAIGQMQGMGVSAQQFAAAPVGTNAQQHYTDTMTAFALQQAANNAAAKVTKKESVEEEAANVSADV